MYLHSKSYYNIKVNFSDVFCIPHFNVQLHVVLVAGLGRCGGLVA